MTKNNKSIEISEYEAQVLIDSIHVYAKHYATNGVVEKTLINLKVKLDRVLQG